MSETTKTSEGTEGTVPKPTKIDKSEALEVIVLGVDKVFMVKTFRWINN